MIVTIDRDTLRTALTSVALAASTDPTRPHQRTVLLEVHQPNTLAIVATNGHWLALWRDRVTVADSAGGAQLLVGANTIKEFTQGLKSASTNDVAIDLDTGIASTGEARVSLARVDETFPRYEMSIPPPREPHMRRSMTYAAFNPTYMTAIAKAFAPYTPRQNPSLVYDFGARDLDPCVITCPEDARMLVVLMPCRGGAQPTWVVPVRDT